MRNNIFITLKKELRGILRDKKYLRIMLLSPLIIPVYVLLMGYIYDSMVSSEYTIGTNYNLNSDEMVIINDLNEEYNVDLLQGYTLEELEKMYSNSKIDGYIIKENDNYTIYTDYSKENGIYAYQISETYLKTYNDFLANNYLINQGINPENVFNIISINMEDLAQDGQDYFSSMLLQIALTYLVMIIIQTAQNTSTDIIAGEKERGTLETMLTFPVKSSDLVTGKFLAITISCIITSILGIILTIPSLIIAKKVFITFSDFQFSLGIMSILISVVIVVLTSLLSAGLCIALSGKAKSFKEAQTATSGLVFLSMFSLFSSVLGIENSVILSIIPIANSGILLNDIFFNEINISNLMAMFISTIIYIIIILKYISNQYKSEKTLF